MNETTSAGIANVDISGRGLLFDVADMGDGERWVTVVLSDLIADWGEGSSEDEAVADLARSLRDVHDELHDEPDHLLAPHLRYQRVFLCALLHPPSSPVPQEAE